MTQEHPLEQFFGFYCLNHVLCLAALFLSPPLIQTSPPAIFFLLGPSQHWRLLRDQTSFSGGMPFNLDLSNCFLVSARFLPTESYTKASLCESDGGRALLAELGWAPGPHPHPSWVTPSCSRPAPPGEFEPPLRLEEASDSIRPCLAQPSFHLLPHFLSSDSLPSCPGVWILPAALGQPVSSPPALLVSQCHGPEGHGLGQMPPHPLGWEGVAALGCQGLSGGDGMAGVGASYLCCLSL